MNESALAQNVIDKLMLQRLRAIPGYLECHESAATWLEQDIAYHGDVYEGYMRQAAEIYPDIAEMWQMTRYEGGYQGEYDTAARQLFGMLLLALVHARRPPELSELYERLTGQIAAYPALQAWFDTHSARVRIPPEPAEIEYVQRHYPVIIGVNNGEPRIILNDDPLGAILCKRVYPDMLIFHSIHGVPAWTK